MARVDPLHFIVGVFTSHPTESHLIASVSFSDAHGGGDGENAQNSELQTFGDHQVAFTISEWGSPALNYNQSPLH